MPNSTPDVSPVVSSKPNEAQAVPTPCEITPELLKTHSMTADEYEKLRGALDRVPSLTELGIFSVMWSEHCSYKSSRVHLKRLPTKGTRTSGPGAVVQGPGENAGIIDVGDGWACAFKIESHNHPSYIEPYQGAATGVGGILRDIFTMGARPMAVMDSLRFGPLTEEGEPDAALRAKNHQVANGVVHGVAGYGNCFGVPNVGGETRFEACYSGNPLLNAFALGLVRTDEIFYAKATGVGNPVFYVGAKTGRDGIHGATMASEEFTEGSEQKRPNVQMGDPFLEKLLLEACLEAMRTGAVLGIQDMGAAGLTCSTCEMGARGELGVTIELDRVPQRETGMTSYEIMLSESQERMLLVAAKGREQEVLDVFAKWGLDCAEVGIVTADNVMRVLHHGELVAEIPNTALTDDAPVYHRPVGTWTSPVPKEPPQSVLDALQKPRDYTADLLRLLASPNICDKRYVYEQYDSMVQTNTVQGPGGEAGVIRIKGTGRSHGALDATEGSRVSGDGSDRAPEVAEESTAARLAERMGLDPRSAEHTVLGEVVNFVTGSHPNAAVTPETVHVNRAAEAASWMPACASVTSADTNGAGAREARRERGLAMALAGNGRWCYLDPKLGAMHAVAEAARKVACTGAVPVAATNCLNFGNPEKPEIMAQLSAAIDGIAEACTALDVPITGGNVSLYNETRGEGIYPTPVIGVVGILDDVTKAVPSAFQRVGDAVLLLTLPVGTTGTHPLREFGSSEFANSILQQQWGTPPFFQPIEEYELQRALHALASGGLIHSASDVSDGGLAVTLAKASIASGIGVWLHGLHTGPDGSRARELFGEDSSLAVVTCALEDVTRVREIIDDFGFVFALDLGHTVTANGVDNDLDFEIAFSDEAPAIQTNVAKLQDAYGGTLPSQLAAEVVTA